MSASRRILTATAATAVIATAAAITPLSAAAVAPVPAAKPGRTASPITLDDNVQLTGYDAATDASGRTYIGWISDENNKGRKVHLCTLPPGARKCEGGIQTIDSLGDSTAASLRVFVTPRGRVTLVWFHDTVASENGPQGSEITTATSQAGGPLSPATDRATAPSFGTMLDAAVAPGGQIWVLTEHSVAGGIQVRPGLGHPFVNLKTPYGVGAARVRFNHGTPVIVIQQAGAISSPVAFTSYRNGVFAAFRRLARTWTAASDIGLTGTSSGVRLVTSEPNAGYHPIVWSWTGSGFGRMTFTGDFNNCSPAGHDLVTDAGGRVADVTNECGLVTIENMADTRHAAIVRFPTHGTPAGGDFQITTTPRGKGWVAWSIESAVGDKLLVAPILLPGLDVTAATSARGNRVVVTGPASCLPPVNVAAGVKGKPARHWHVVSSVLRLGRTVLRSGTLRGGTLNAGARYALSGTVRFADGGSRVTITATLKFRSCPNG